MFIDTRAASAPASILPKAKPLLHSLRAKDPVELENSGYVSFSMYCFCVCVCILLSAAEIDIKISALKHVLRRKASMR